MSIEMSAEKWDALHRWVRAASEAIYAYLMMSQPVFDELAPKPGAQPFVARQLAVSCHLTSESALLLLAHGRLWDGEILVRAVIEGTAKYAYMGTGTEEERQQRVKEYWTDLPEADRLKRHERISEFFKLVGDRSDSRWMPLQETLLEDAERDRIRSEYPRQIRKELSHKWSFSEILIALHESSFDRGLFRGATTLMYGYGMGSHLVHQDGNAIGMIWERNNRSPERRELVQIAHAGRQISDICVMAFIRAWVTLKLCERSTEPAVEQWKGMERVSQEIDQVQNQWWAIERQFNGPTEQENEKVEEKE